MSATIAEIMQDGTALAAACAELAEFLLERAAFIESPAAHHDELWRLLPLMCAFPSPDHLRLAAVRLRAIVRKLDAMPATKAELALVMMSDETSYAAFEHALLGATAEAGKEVAS